MKFLYIMLGSIWLSFAWVTYQSVQWQPPYPVPREIPAKLKNIDQEQFNSQIKQLRQIIMQSNLPASEIGWAHYLLAEHFWLKTFMENTRQRQNVFLTFSLSHCEEAIRYKPDDHRYLLLAGKIHEIRGDTDEAQEFYSRSLQFAIAAESDDVRRIERRLRRISEQRPTS